MSLFSLLELGARRYPHEGAIFHGVDQVCDWDGLKERALRLAGAMNRHTTAGDRVAIVSKNCPEYVEILFAAWAAGLVVVPVNAKLHPREMLQILQDADPALILGSPDICRDLSVLAGTRDLAPIFEIGGAGYLALLSGAAVEPVDVAPEALAWLFYTSGTTGRSKGAMLTHRNLQAMVIAHLADFESLDHTHALIHAAPMSHGSGLYILPYVGRAARQIIPASGGFDASEFLDLCDTHAGVGAFLAPTMLRRLRIEAEQAGRGPTGLRSIIYGGGPMYLEELRQSLRTFGPILRQLYGQGEAPMTISGLTQADHRTDDAAVLGSVGWPRSGVQVAVLDAAGKASAPGEIGEIVCRGDVVMAGYWKNPEATAAALRDGWLLTGDMGALDADGKLTLHARSKEVIISGGANIYPREVEEALLSCAGVDEVCVLGVPDAEWGEIVVAFVVRQSLSGVPTEAMLDAHCVAQIARFKRPKRYLFIEALPKSSYGKVLKRELSALLDENAMAPQTARVP